MPALTYLCHSTSINYAFINHNSDLLKTYNLNVDLKKWLLGCKVVRPDFT